MDLARDHMPLGQIHPRMFFEMAFALGRGGGGVGCINFILFQTSAMSRNNKRKT